jgi:hypothetical protein
MLFKAYIPEALTGVAEQFAVTLTLSVFKSYKPVSLTASLFGFLGLVIGIVLFISKGVKEIFD